MNDSTDKTATGLAIVEKRPQTPVGGCVGIFFKLVDWNRKFSKKFFSKKLLPSGSVRAKQDSNKFVGDEKLPKHRLIAHENSGGFPTMKKKKKKGDLDVVSEDKHEGRAPGLIGRLMGLESMPAAKKDEPKKGLVSVSDRGGKAIDHRGFGKGVVSLGKGRPKQKLRPQKLQKTAPLEKRLVPKFGVEALQFKNMLSRPRKHPPKLASPLKSSRNLSGRNASRLIGAATKILEPGLQTRMRAKSAITYANILSQDETELEWTPALSVDPLYNSSRYVIPATSLTSQPSCRNCGSLVDSVNFRLNAGEQPSAFASSLSNDINLPLQGSETSRPKRSTLFHEQGSQRNLQQSVHYAASASDQAINNFEHSSQALAERNSLYKSQTQSNRTSEPRKNVAYSTCFKQNTQGKSLFWDGVPPHSKLSNLQRASVSIASNEPRDFVALNQCSSGYTRSRIPSKVDSCKLKVEREFSNRVGNFLPTRKRSTNGSRQAKSSAFVRSAVQEHWNVGLNTATRKQVGCNADPSTSQPYSRIGLRHVGENTHLSATINELKDVISFNNSPMKQKTKIAAQVEGNVGQNECSCTSISKRSMALDGNGKSKCLQKPLPLRVEFLGALLEDKLKELTCQEQELATGRAPTLKTPAMILQELRYALTGERPFPQDNVSLRYKQKNSLQAQQTNATSSLNISHDGDNLSPGSVLGASFSNGSCFSSSLDDSLVPEQKQYDDSMDSSCDEPQQDVCEVDLLDSAASLNEGSCRELNDLVSHISNVLCSLNIEYIGLKESKLDHAIEVILVAELVFRSAIPPIFYGNIRFSISLFLLDELETIASIMCANFGCSLGAEDVKEGYEHRGFAFDCIIEYLDSTCGRYLKAGPDAWTILPLQKNAKMLIFDVFSEARRWSDLAGYTIDELLEKEMNCAFEELCDFQSEECEMVAEIDACIILNLVEEIVRDLWDCRFGFYGTSYEPVNY